MPPKHAFAARNRAKTNPGLGEKQLRMFGVEQAIMAGRVDIAEIVRLSDEIIAYVAPIEDEPEPT